MIAKVTKEQFEDYVRIRNSGITNMFDIKTVCALSHTGLKKEHCLSIMQNFSGIAKEYGVDV